MSVFEGYTEKSKLSPREMATLTTVCVNSPVDMSMLPTPSAPLQTYIAAFVRCNSHTSAPLSKRYLVLHFMNIQHLFSEPPLCSIYVFLIFWYYKTKL